MKRVLIINALFSGLSGILLIVLHKPVAHMFGVNSSSPFWIVGIVLLLFSVSIVYEIKRQNSLAILWIITQDLFWVIASVYLLIFNPFDISLLGNYTVAVVAIIVLIMAINQVSALAKVDTVNISGDKQFKFSRTVKATKSDAWTVISDVANYHKVAPNIDDVKIMSGNGEGMIRSCSHRKESWTETCTSWQEGQSYSFVVNTAAPDYPYPLKSLKGTWRLEKLDNNHTAIIMIFDFAYKMKIQSILLHSLLGGKFKKTVEDLLDNWQKILEK